MTSDRCCSCCWDSTLVLPSISLLLPPALSFPRSLTSSLSSCTPLSLFPAAVFCFLCCPMRSLFAAMHESSHFSHRNNRPPHPQNCSAQAVIGSSIEPSSVARTSVFCFQWQTWWTFSVQKGKQQQKCPNVVKQKSAQMFFFNASHFRNSVSISANSKRVGKSTVQGEMLIRWSFFS